LLDLAPDETTLIGRFPFSHEARSLLGSLLRDLDQPESVDRISLVARHLQMRPKLTKTVVFSRFHHVAEKLAAVMTAEAGPSSIARQLGNMDAVRLEEELERFEHDTFCRSLICDSSAEEGRNLQFADCLVHVDLHMNPNRLEQRIGRTDRYSSGRAAESIVFQDDPRLQPGYQPAWLTCLVEGFRVFDESIAGVQYAVERVMSEVRLGVFTDGVRALIAAQDVATSALAAERLAIAEQDALDGIEAVETDTSLFSSLDNLENDWRSLRKAVCDWAADAKGSLRFERTEDSADPNVIQFAVNPERREPTLNNMPLVAWDALAESFGEVVRRKGSFRRETALGIRGARVFRIGEPFIDALASFTRWDDRGRAFATWRHRGEWRGNPDFVAIRFDYILEGDATPALETIAAHGGNLERSVAQRRIDACFPPIIATIWLDVGLEEISNSTVLKIVSDAYEPSAGDVNLSVTRQWALDEVISRDLWEPLLRDARRQSQQLLIVRADVMDGIQAAQERAKQQAEIVLEQLQVRVHAGQIGGADVMATAHDLNLEHAISDAVVAGVATPIINLDSVGVVILSGRMPEGLRQEAEEADDGG
jgi:ATP-dependent helicase HepA